MTYTEAEIKKYNRIIPLYFVAFFLVIFIVDGIFVYTALNTHTGLVTEHAYQKGLDYNTTIDASEKQEKLGWQGEIHFTTDQLSYAPTTHDGTPITGAAITAHFIRPTQAGMDFSLPLVEHSKGEYSTKVTFPHKGQWNTTLVITWQQQQQQKTTQILAP